MVSLFSRRGVSLLREVVVLGTAMTMSTTALHAQNLPQSLPGNADGFQAQTAAAPKAPNQYQPSQAPAQQYQAPQSDSKPQPAPGQQYEKKSFYPGYSSGPYQSTQEEQQKCIPDVFRLCTAFIPDAKQVVACLVAKTPELSPECRAVINNRIPAKKPRGRRRRAGSGR